MRKLSQGDSLNEYRWSMDRWDGRREGIEKGEGKRIKKSVKETKLENHFGKRKRTFKKENVMKNT